MSLQVKKISVSQIIKQKEAEKYFRLFRVSLKYINT
jgi:hypothetical protein